MDAQEIDRVCDEFERRIRSDGRIRIEDFIGDRDQDVSDELIVELLRIEMELVGSVSHAKTVEGRCSVRTRHKNFATCKHCEFPVYNEAVDQLDLRS